MKNLFIFLFVGLYLTFGQSACKSNNQLSDTVSKKVLYDSTNFYVISVAYPLDSRDANKEMEAYAKNLFNSHKEEWEIGGELYKSEQEITKEFPDRAGYSYDFQTEYDSLRSNKMGMISYVFNYFEYTGGANGFSGVYTFTFSDAKKAICINDVLNFSNGNDLALTKLLAETALKDLDTFNEDFVMGGLGLSGELREEEPSQDNQKCKIEGSRYGSNFQNFALTDAGITFYYNKYDLAPGVAGVTHVNLSWDQLKPYLKKLVNS